MLIWVSQPVSNIKETLFCIEKFVARHSGLPFFSDANKLSYFIQENYSKFGECSVFLICFLYIRAAINLMT